MACPECGKPTEPDQHFCRDCGAQLTAGGPNKMQLGGLGVLVLIFGGLMVGITGKMFDMRWLAYLGVIVMFIGVFIIAAFSIVRETGPRGRSRRRTAAAPQLATIEKADTTSKLLPIGTPDYVPSVTDSTTELLKTPVNHR